MRDLNDLKARVFDAIVLIVAVYFLQVLVSACGGSHIVEYGIGVALVIMVLTIFRVGTAHYWTTPPEEPNERLSPHLAQALERPRTDQWPRNLSPISTRRRFSLLAGFQEQVSVLDEVPTIRTVSTTQPFSALS